jgi:ATP-dependent protease ClpP protease subunit
MSDASAGGESNPLPIYAAFAGMVDQQAVERFLTAFASMRTVGAAEARILFQSSGGFVADGICLYNLFRAAPVRLTLYNCGGVQSIATIAYLGAEQRVVSQYGAFMIHRTGISPQHASAGHLESLARSAAISDKSTEAILRAHLKADAALWERLDRGDVALDSHMALELGLATEIGEFPLPFGITPTVI